MAKKLTKTEIMDKLVKIQEKHGNNPKKFHKDKDFIKWNSLLGRTRRKVISLHTIKKPNVISYYCFRCKIHHRYSSDIGKQHNKR